MVLSSQGLVTCPPDGEGLRAKPGGGYPWKARAHRQHPARGEQEGWLSPPRGLPHPRLFLLLLAVAPTLGGCSAKPGSSNAQAPAASASPSACAEFASTTCVPESPCWLRGFGAYFPDTAACVAWAQAGCERLTALPHLGFSAQDLRSVTLESWRCGEELPEGTLGEGVACVGDLQCASHRCREGVCATTLKLGEACLATSDAVPCGTDRGRRLFCDERVHACRAVSADGGECISSGACDRWSHCVGGRCMRAPRAGEPCPIETCANGSRCVEGRCQLVETVREEGAACSPERLCGAGLKCAGSPGPSGLELRCRAASRPCAPCAVSGANGLFYLPPGDSCPLGYTCRENPGKGTGVCEPTPGPLAAFEPPCPAGAR